MADYWISIAPTLADATVQVTVHSVNDYHGQVSLSYSTTPSSPDVTLNKADDLLTVPKNSFISTTVTITFVDANTQECTFSVTGTDGSSTVGDDAMIPRP